MKNIFEIIDIVGGYPAIQSSETAIAARGKLQKVLVLGVAATAFALTVGMGPGLIVPTSGQSRILHKLQ